MNPDSPSPGCRRNSTIPFALRVEAIGDELRKPCNPGQSQHPAKESTSKIDMFEGPRQRNYAVFQIDTIAWIVGDAR